LQSVRLVAAVAEVGSIGSERKKPMESQRLGFSVAPHIRRATANDTQTVVKILIASKEVSFTIDEHDRDVQFWTRRWRGYIVSGSSARQSRGDGWVFLAEVERQPVGYVAYHHTKRHGTDAELQNIYVLKQWQGRGIGTRLLGCVAHRLSADGSRTLCVGYDPDSPYKRFYIKYGAVEIQPGSPWASQASACRIISDAIWSTW